MPSSKSKVSYDFAPLIATAADLCMRPWKHAVIETSYEKGPGNYRKLDFELIMRIECRSEEGERFPKYDLELELYRSGKDINLMLSWPELSDRPILWQGKHPVWMNADNGTRCESPVYGKQLEAFARRLIALYT